MAIQETQIKEMSGGFSKGIDSGAMDMIFDNLQISQYLYPIKSVIREVVSNGLDSIREKNIAKQILSGAAKVEDYYTTREGDLYKDSHFNPSYYNTAFLADRDDVVITYIDGGAINKDLVTIQDYGVGLGGDRLRGYFQLGYSSKRLNKFALGKFGLGAKSPLATRENFYTMTTRWNGMEFSFNIYGHRVESIVPQYDMETRQENPEYVWPAKYDSNGTKIMDEVRAYYRITDKDNSVIVTMMAKKHHKQQYIDAVTSQLLYFDNVRLFVESEDTRSEIPVKANILYEDDLIVMSTNAPYSKPHILLNGVNYGFIDFKELELEEKMGNIGIKVAPEKVSVNPSRESLIWDDVTREVVVNRFKEVVGIAEKTISDQLAEEDILKWLKICLETTEAKIESRFGQGANGNILTRLASIIDMSTIKLKYKPHPSIIANYSLFDGISIETVSIKLEREGNKNKRTITYRPTWRESIHMGLPIFLVGKSFSNRVNRYLISKVYPQGFVAIKLKHPHGVAAEDITQEEAYKRIDRREKDFQQNEEAYVKRAKQHIAKLTNLIHESTVPLIYEDVVVPDDFSMSEDAVEEEIEVEEAKETPNSKTSAERRKLEGKILIQTPYAPLISRSGNGYRSDCTNYSFSKVEVEASYIDKWSSKEIYWGNDAERSLIELAATIGFTTKNAPDYNSNLKDGVHALSPGHSTCLHWLTGNKELMLFKVAQNNSKLFNDFAHITRFFKKIHDKKITMSNVLIQWNTARLLKEGMEKLEFLVNFKSISPDTYNAYMKIKQYVGKYYRGLDTLAENHQDQFINHLDNVARLQLFVRQNPEDSEAIAALVKTLFNPDPKVIINDGAAIDLEYYDVYLQLLDWSQAVQVMMNMVGPSSGGEFSEEEEAEIRSYFKYRNVQL